MYITTLWLKTSNLFFTCTVVATIRGKTECANWDLQLTGYQSSFMSPQDLPHLLVSYREVGTRFLQRICIVEVRDMSRQSHRNFLRQVWVTFSPGFTPPSGMLQPSRYQTPPPEDLCSGGGGHQLAFTPSHLPQQGMRQYDYPFFSSFSQVRSHEKL